MKQASCEEEMRHWRTLCRVSRFDAATVHVVAPASLCYWFTVKRSEWPAELPLVIGQFFHARVNIGANSRKEMSMKPPYEDQ